MDSHRPKQSALEKRLQLLQKEMKPSRAFVLSTKDKVFTHIENAQARKKASFLEKALMPFLKQVGAFAFSFIFVLTLWNVVFMATLQSTKADYIGEVTNHQGKVYIVRSSEKIEVTSPQKVYEGDTIEVDTQSNAQVYFYNAGETRLSENTKLKINKVVRQENKENVIAVNLEKGSLEGKVDPVGNTGSGTAKLAVVTTSGTLEAKNNATFALSLNDNGTIASVSASSEKVDLIAAASTSTEAQTLTVNAGQTLTNPIASSVTSTTDTQSGSTIIVTTDTVPAIRQNNVNTNKPEIENIPEKKPSKTRPVQTTSGAKIVEEKSENENSNIIVSLPETSIDVYQLGQIQDIDVAVNIAQVKLNNAVNSLNNKDETQALIDIKSYLSTLERMNTLVGTIQPGNTSGKFSIKQLSDFIDTTALTTINSRYAATRDIVNPENRKAYNASMKKLHYLARVEAGFKFRLQLAKTALSENK